MVLAQPFFCHSIVYKVSNNEIYSLYLTSNITCLEGPSLNNQFKPAPFSLLTVFILPSFFNYS